MVIVLSTCLSPFDDYVLAPAFCLILPLRQHRVPIVWFAFASARPGAPMEGAHCHQQSGNQTHEAATRAPSLRLEDSKHEHEIRSEESLKESLTKHRLERLEHERALRGIADVSPLVPLAEAVAAAAVAWCWILLQVLEVHCVHCQTHLAEALAA